MPFGDDFELTASSHERKLLPFEGVGDTTLLPWHSIKAIRKLLKLPRIFW